MSAPESIARLEFVAFHSFDRPDTETAAQIALFARSVRSNYPEAAVRLLTNAEGAGLPWPPEVRVDVVDVASRFVMVERLKAYRDRAKAAEADAVLVFMDTDMLVIRRFDELLQPGADLAVSVRRDPVWPINAGLLVARMHERAGVEAFFDRLTAACEALGDNDRLWYGDQVALAQVLRPERGRFRALYAAERDGLTVRFAPGRLYNQTPRPWMMRLGIYRGAARILHFKGGRKRRMAFYARLHLSAAFRAWRRVRLSR